jgi:hypothetical protein
MRRPFSTLLLLLAFGFGFLTGPHPCGASHAERESAPASCHETQPSPTGPQEEDGNGCGAFCQHACHMAAIAEAEPVAFAISPVSETIAEPSCYGLPLFSHPIDHIPLA